MKKLLFIIAFLLYGCGFNIKNDLQSVVKISVLTPQSSEYPTADIWVATGFSIENGHKILTNHHVCLHRDGSLYRITDIYGNVSNATFIRNDDSVDICLLSVESFIKPIYLNKSNPNQGDEVLIIGSPHGELPMIEKGFISGYVFINHDEEGLKTSQKAMGLSAIIYSGSSGSPVINSNNRVVGIIFCTREDSPMLSYMIPISLIHNFLDNNENIIE